jgi:hypothetical protein
MDNTTITTNLLMNCLDHFSARNLGKERKKENILREWEDIEQSFHA